MGMVCFVLVASIDVDIPHGVGGYALGTVLAALAAAFCAVGSVMQHHQAVADSDPAAGLGLRRLVGRPGWLLGQSAIVVGTVLQVAALGLALVAIVQPILGAVWWSPWVSALSAIAGCRRAGSSSAPAAQPSGWPRS